MPCLQARRLRAPRFEYALCGTDAADRAAYIRTVIHWWLLTLCSLSCVYYSGQSVGAVFRTLEQARHFRPPANRSTGMSAALRGQTLPDFRGRRDAVIFPAHPVGAVSADTTCLLAGARTARLAPFASAYARSSQPNAGHRHVHASAGAAGVWSADCSMP